MESWEITMEGQRGVTAAKFLLNFAALKVDSPYDLVDVR